MAVSDGVLVLRALGIGDLLTAVPALRGLRRRWPDERLVLAAPGELADLVELIDAVDELLPTPGLGTLRWPGDPPRLAVNLHGRGPESIRDLLAVGPSELLTYRHPDVPAAPGPDWRGDLHEVDRWCHLVEYGHAPADPTDLRLPAPPEPSPAPGAVLVHPGAGSPARRWPAGRFARVAGELAADGHEVVLTGSPSEYDLARGIAESAGLPPDSVLAGRIGLGELAATVSGASLVVCGDTGVGHLATAFATPSVLLFGPTPPRFWGPPGHRPDHVVLWTGDAGDPHAPEPDPGLLLLTPERVSSAAHELLSRKVPHG